MSAWWVPFLYLSASDAAFSRKPGLCLALLLFLLPVSPTGISTEAPPCKCGQSSNSRFRQPTLLSRFTNLEIWPEASTKIHLFCFFYHPPWCCVTPPAGAWMRLCWPAEPFWSNLGFVGSLLKISWTSGMLGMESWLLIVKESWFILMFVTCSNNHWASPAS